MEKAAALIGNPHKELKFIHVAGTNGKGSVTTKCAKMLELSGNRVGLFISPHICTFRERIQINGELIEKEFVAEFLHDLFKLAERNSLDLTFFEYVTLLGFEYFKVKKTDIVSLETGLGGRLDATNIVDPLISIITSIGLDHMDSLGPTIHHIAEEKAGIIKPNRPVILGPCLPDEIFTKKATQTNSRVTSLKPDEFTVKDFNNENTRIAQEAIRVLCETYPDINVTPEAVAEGSKATQPCRLEYVDTSSSTNPLIKDKKVILDVSHNPPAIEKCLLSVVLRNPGHNIRIVYGSSGHKDSYSCFQVMKDYVHKIHIMQAKHSRSKKLNELLGDMDQVKSEVTEDSSKDMFEEIVNNGDVTSTLNYAFEQSAKAENPEVIVVLGSFYIMPETRKYFGYKDDLDPVF